MTLHFANAINGNSCTQGSSAAMCDLWETAD